MGRIGYRRVGLQCTDDLNERHHRNRIEEVGAHDAIGALGRRGNRGDRNRRGVACHDATVGHDVVELGEQRRLVVDGLTDRFDDDLAIAHGLEIGREGDATEDDVGRLLELALLLLLGEGGLHALLGHAQDLVVSVDNKHVATRLGANFSDSRAHEPAAHNTKTIHV